MIDYLKKYNINDEGLEQIRQRYNTDYLNYFVSLKDCVEENLDYLKSLGVSNFKNVLLYRADLCFKDLDVLKRSLSKYDIDLVAKLFDDDVEDLINFEI